MSVTRAVIQSKVILPINNPQTTHTRYKWVCKMWIESFKNYFRERKPSADGRTGRQTDGQPLWGNMIPQHYRVSVYKNVGKKTCIISYATNIAWLVFRPKQKYYPITLMPAMHSNNLISCQWFYYYMYIFFSFGSDLSNCWVQFQSEAILPVA